METSKPKRGINISLSTTIISLIILFTFVFFMVIKPTQTLSGVTTAFNGIVKIFGAPLMVFTFVTTVLAFYLAFGKYRHVKLGDEKPEYSTFSYISMMVNASIASAAVYWSFTEWGYYVMTPGIHLTPFSAQAYEASLGYSFFHWGFATQGPYVLTGVAIAYAVYNKKVKFMKLSTVCEKMMGNFKYRKIVGKIIDLFVIFCILGALSCSLGLAIPLGIGALKQAFGIQSSFGLQVGFVLLRAVIFTFTSFVGVKKGMKNISNFASVTVIIILAFILFAGPTIFIMKNFVSSLGWMSSSYLRMSTFLDPVDNSGFPEAWTLFFQAFCLTYTAMVGIFIAKVSKGRTIRELSLCTMLGISIGVWILFAIDGGFAMHSQLTGVVNVTDILKSGAGQDSIYQVVSHLPLGNKILPIIMMLAIIALVAAVLDSASFSLSQTTTKLDEAGKENKWLRIFWCFVLTLLPLSIMFAKADFTALKDLAIVVSIPFMFVVIFMEFMLFRWFKQDRLNGTLKVKPDPVIPKRPKEPIAEPAPAAETVATADENALL